MSWIQLILWLKYFFCRKRDNFDVDKFFPLKSSIFGINFGWIMYNSKILMMPFKTWWNVLKPIFASEYSIFLHLNVLFFENSFLLKITKSAHFQITFVSSFIFVICFYFIKKSTLSCCFFFSTHFPMNFSILSLSFIFFLHTLKMKGKNYVEVLLSGMMTIEFFLIPFCTMKLIFNLFKIFFFFFEKKCRNICWNVTCGCFVSWCITTNIRM